jgi:hypothetical protein
MVTFIKHAMAIRAAQLTAARTGILFGFAGLMP